MAYKGSEDLYGQQGGPLADGLNEYLGEDPVVKNDIVLWYAAHLFHQNEEGGDEFHHAGPSLHPFGPWDC